MVRVEILILDFFTILEHIIVGPVAALTFIGSMGNIPLAALLFGKGVSFAGVMAFIFSDLVVFPILRINAKYYGWKMSFFYPVPVIHLAGGSVTGPALWFRSTEYVARSFFRKNSGYGIF